MFTNKLSLSHRKSNDYVGRKKICKASGGICQLLQGFQKDLVERDFAENISSLHLHNDARTSLCEILESHNRCFRTIRNKGRGGWKHLSDILLYG